MVMSFPPRRPIRRYGVLLAAAAVFLVIYAYYFSTPRMPTYVPHAEIKYVRSSRDWGQQRIFFPVQDPKPLPAGIPLQLPQVQARQSPKLKDDVVDARKQAIKRSFVKSWNAYKKYAWAKDELTPLSRGGRKSLSGWGAQIVDAMDTMWIMGLKDDFGLALHHVAAIDFENTGGSDIDVFEVTIRYLGGLLGAYDLSQEPVLLSKAVELGDTLYAAFDTPNRLPVASLSYSNARKGKQQGLVSMLSAVGGSLCMEFTRLSQLTGDHKYYDATERVKELLYREQNKTEVPGLWPRVLNFRDGVAEQSMFTLGAGADSLYEYLPKMYALLGGLDVEYEEMAVQALEAARYNLLFRPMTPGEDDILLAGNVLSYRQEVSHAYEMQHLTCFSGGMYALAGKLLSRPDFVDVGARLTAGCVWAYNSFPTKIMPEISELVPCESLTGPCPYPHQAFPRNTPNLGLPDGFVRVRDTIYALRPEAIESVFYMWRITGDELWRDAAWRMWENIVRETETDVAFATVTDVTTIGGPKSDNMDTFWLAETLKYFYLIFDDESTLDLDDWVLNTEAHPFKRPRKRFRS